MTTARIYVEVGRSRSFASSVDWPGWSRSGKTEAAAIATLLEYAPRYAAVLRRRVDGFSLPDSVEVVERVRGESGTDFGVPGHEYPADEKRLSGKELERQLAVLQACWDQFARVARTDRGKTLRTGPRGGGRTLDKVVEHVRDADAAYVSALGGRAKPEGDDPVADLRRIHKVFLETLRGRLDGSVPAVGPRGGAKWPIRFAIRYVAWHSLDHAWEIEDRVLE